MMTSDVRPEVEIRLFRACTMKNMHYKSITLIYGRIAKIFASLRRSDYICIRNCQLPNSQDYGSSFRISVNKVIECMRYYLLQITSSVFYDSATPAFQQCISSLDCNRTDPLYRLYQMLTGLADGYVNVLCDNTSISGRLRDSNFTNVVLILNMNTLNRRHQMTCSIKTAYMSRIAHVKLLCCDRILVSKEQIII